jgi:hypothetical protein
MAIAQNELQVTWSAANSKSVATATSETSDAEAVSSNAISISFELKADHSTTPGADDTVDFYLLPTLGDPDGASTDEYATAGHAVFLATLDTNTDDPAIAVIFGNFLPMTDFKILAENNAGESITVSAIALEITG